jgi:hypothetical protein
MCSLVRATLNNRALVTRDSFLYSLRGDERVGGSLIAKASRIAVGAVGTDLTPPVRLDPVFCQTAVWDTRLR